MDFNYNIGKNIETEPAKLRMPEIFPDETVLKEDESNKIAESIKAPKSKKITADSTAIDAVIKQALARGQNNIQKVTEKEKPQKQAANSSSGNIFKAACITENITVEETANNIFNDGIGNIVGNDTGIITGGESGIASVTFESLVTEWNNTNFDNIDYQTRIEMIDAIIAAAETDEDIATWTCYKYILRNNYRKQQYEEYLRQLASGEKSYDELGWGAEFWEYSTSLFNSEDEDELDVFKYFGGTYTYNYNTYPITWTYTPPENDFQAYLYCNAMIARYSTKIYAIRLRLQDPNIQANSTLKNKLEKDIYAYQVFLHGFLPEKKRLAELLGFGETWDNGSFHYFENVQNGGLVPGLTPPENSQQAPPPEEDYQTMFQNLVNEYNTLYGNIPPSNSSPERIAKAQKIVNFAKKMVQRNEEPVDYWNHVYTEWQNKLNQLINGN